MENQAKLGAESIAEAIDMQGKFALNVVNQRQLEQQNPQIET